MWQCGEQDKGYAILWKRSPPKAGMAELADAADSKSADRKVVGVRPPLPAPNIPPLIDQQHLDRLAARIFVAVACPNAPGSLAARGSSLTAGQDEML